MPLGTERDLSTVNIGDSAELYTYLFDENNDAIPQANITSVSFEIKKPDGTHVILPGTVQSDGAGYLRYTATSVIGEYIAVVTFHLATGEVKSNRIDFSVIDPFDSAAPDTLEGIAETTWMLLEDCFDSEEGGPWLRDETLSYFNKEKVKLFVPFSLLDINAFQPITALTIADFAPINGAPNPALPIVAYGTLIQVIRHLMRSYVEQPQPMGAEVVYEDRRDYLQRWQLILQDLITEFDRLTILWKRQFLNLGQSALLVHSKAGRLYGPGAPGLRARYAGRGYGY